LICVLSRKDLERLMLEQPRVGLRFLEQLSARLLETEAIVEDFAFSPSRRGSPVPCCARPRRPRTRRSTPATRSWPT
jgi:CRP-like cAMP-binding protein